jgi:hypothetical protein
MSEASSFQVQKSETLIRRWKKIRNLILFWLSKSGVSLLSSKKLNTFLKVEWDYRRFEKETIFIQHYGIHKGVNFLSLHKQSRSQLGQDMWVAFASGFRRHGTFLEIGSADGFTLSNTYMLEKGLSWTGVCVEPAKVWHLQFQKLRRCVLDERCCFSTDDVEMTFLETPQPLLSTLTQNRFSDSHGHERVKGSEYSVRSVSLNSLFAQYFPRGYVDFLSIDTEGSEEEILNSFDFSRYHFNFAAIEIGFDTDKRNRIETLLSKNGYRRVWEELSEFDDFYEKI